MIRRSDYDPPFGTAPPTVAAPHPPPPPGAPSGRAGSPLTADQEIRSDALQYAIQAVAELPGWSGYSPLAVASQFAEWIRSGWPRIDGNDGELPNPLPSPADGAAPWTEET